MLKLCRRVRARDERQRTDSPAPHRGRKSLAIQGSGRQQHRRHVRPRARSVFKSIRDGRPINDGQHMCNSTMIAIMGRMCTYTGRNVDVGPMRQQPAAAWSDRYAWADDVPPIHVAIPGRRSLSNRRRIKPPVKRRRWNPLKSA